MERAPAKKNARDRPDKLSPDVLLPGPPELQADRIIVSASRSRPAILLAVSSAPAALAARGGAEVTIAGSSWQRNSAGSSAWVAKCSTR